MNTMWESDITIGTLIILYAVLLFMGGSVNKVRFKALTKNFYNILLSRLKLNSICGIQTNCIIKGDIIFFPFQ